MGVRRLSTLSAVFTMLTILYGAAKVFVGDSGLLGLSDASVRAVVHFSGYGLLALLLATVLGHWRLAADRLAGRDRRD